MDLGCSLTGSLPGTDPHGVAGQDKSPSNSASREANPTKRVENAHSAQTTESTKLTARITAASHGQEFLNALQLLRLRKRTK